MFLLAIYQAIPSISLFIMTACCPKTKHTICHQVHFLRKRFLHFLNSRLSKIFLVHLFLFLFSQCLFVKVVFFKLCQVLIFSILVKFSAFLECESITFFYQMFFYILQIFFRFKVYFIFYYLYDDIFLFSKVLPSSEFHMYDMCTYNYYILNTCFCFYLILR